MFLLVGLGNPGAEYKKTRHNAGFMVIDEVCRQYDIRLEKKKKFLSEGGEGVIAGHKVAVIKPTTYMNNSGSAVQAAASFYKISPAKIIVFHDEIALAFAKVRVKTGGSAAGHNGLKDIDSHLGKDYARVRIGIHHPGDKDAVSDYVLHPFAKEEYQKIQVLNEIIGQYLPVLLDGKPDLFMTKISQTPQVV
jgi:peptidyl-tRNA hydrolase, PTH1 family